MTFAEISTFLAGQQVLTGFIGAGVAGGLLYALRAAPAKLAMAAREALSVSLIVDSDDPVYAHLSIWLARHKAARRARRLMLAEAYDYDKGEWGWEITLGQGWHLIWFAGSPLIIHRHVQEPDALAKAVGGGRRERLMVASLGSAQAAIRALLDEARAIYLGGGLVQVSYWTGGMYQVADKRRKRSLETVFLPAAQKARLVADLERFAQAKEVYLARGIPWRRGYLLEGPPGTGKTTLIHVLAGLIGRSIYVVNLNNLAGDNELISAVNAVGSDGVLVIEDIDGVKITRDRDLVEADRRPAQVMSPGPFAVPAPMAEAQARGITLGGLLNAIDGVTAREGRMLFITSNRPEQLDPALLRAGRIDVRERIEKLGAGEAAYMVRAFWPDASPQVVADLLAQRLPIAAAELQNMLLTREGLTGAALAPTPTGDAQ